MNDVVLIGLGRMGRAMAERYAAAGWSVRTWEGDPMKRCLLAVACVSLLGVGGVRRVAQHPAGPGLVSPR